MSTVSQHPGASLQLTSVARVFPGSGEVLRPIDLTIASGEFVALLGPSGCGKSTLLRLIAGLDVPDHGQMAIEAFGRKYFRSYVFQDATLIPWYDVVRNVALPLELIGTPKDEARERALTTLGRVGLAAAAERRPAQLSGGMKMRVSVARALVTEPSLLLLDEPFAALDEDTRHALQDELHRLWRTHRMTVVFVTHSVAEAAYLATRTLVLSPRPAKVLLDRISELGDERNFSLRTDARYMREMQAIYAGLQVGKT